MRTQTDERILPKSAHGGDRIETNGHPRQKRPSTTAPRQLQNKYILRVQSLVKIARSILKTSSTSSAMDVDISNRGASLTNGRV